MSSETKDDKDKIIKRFRDLCDFALTRLLSQTTSMQLFAKAFNMYFASVGNEQLLQTVGSWFFDNAKQISEENLEYFLNYDFEAQMKQWSVLTMGFGGNIIDDFKNNIMLSLKTQSTKNKNLILKPAKEMLQLYCDYVLLLRSEK